jgi:HK97 family phage major capsid protein
MQTQAQTSYNRHTPGRLLQALALGRNPSGAAAFIQSQRWTDQRILLAAVDPLTTESGDADLARQPVGDAFLTAMRAYSVALRLEGMRRVPMLTRLFISSTGVVVGEVGEGEPIPVLKGDWTVHILRPRKFAGIYVATRDLIESMEPTASAAIGDDLAQATAISENQSFISPNIEGSLLYGAPNINASGTNAAAISTDLLALFGMVKGNGRGLALVMDEETATNVHFSNPAMFPDVGPMGGSICGVPVLITDAARIDESPETRIIGLVNATQVFFADRGRVRLDIATDAAIAMSDAPLGAAERVSLFQTDAVATRAIREVSWYARPGVAAYVTGY